MAVARRVDSSASSFGFVSDFVSDFESEVVFFVDILPGFYSRLGLLAGIVLLVGLHSQKA